MAVNELIKGGGLFHYRRLWCFDEVPFYGLTTQVNIEAAKVLLFCIRLRKTDQLFNRLLTRKAGFGLLLFR